VVRAAESPDKARSRRPLADFQTALSLPWADASAWRLRKNSAENIAAIAKACRFAASQCFSTQFRPSFQYAGRASIYRRLH
jgi:hypothetical protein